jgi:hypothetical protein
MNRELQVDGATVSAYVGGRFVFRPFADELQTGAEIGIIEQRRHIYHAVDTDLVAATGVKSAMRECAGIQSGSDTEFEGKKPVGS